MWNFWWIVSSWKHGIVSKQDISDFEYTLKNNSNFELFETVFDKIIFYIKRHKSNLNWLPYFYWGALNITRIVDIEKTSSVEAFDNILYIESINPWFIDVIINELSNIEFNIENPTRKQWNFDKSIIQGIYERIGRTWVITTLNKINDDVSHIDIYDERFAWYVLKTEMMSMKKPDFLLVSRLFDTAIIWSHKMITGTWWAQDNQILESFNVFEYEKFEELLKERLGVSNIRYWIFFDWNVYNIAWSNYIKNFIKNNDLENHEKFFITNTNIFEEYIIDNIKSM